MDQVLTLIVYFSLGYSIDVIVTGFVVGNIIGQISLQL